MTQQLIQPRGPGTHLKRMLARLGFTDDGKCKCSSRAAQMNLRGCDWCEANLDRIGGWLVEAAAERGIPLLRMIARRLARRAVRKAKAEEGMVMKDFERVYVVNLARRQDRLLEFKGQLPDDWPLPPIRRFNAIDGQRVKPPAAWGAGAGAWGCYRSHLAIMEQCLNDGVESVLIFEDDAQLCEHFPQRLHNFMAAVLDDWEVLYLGGQHLKQHTPPHRVNDNCYVPFNVNRTHAYALRGEGLRVMYQQLSDFGNPTFKPDSHIDHRMGKLLENQLVVAYCPAEWLVQQSGSGSNIGDTVPATGSAWRGAEAIAPKPMVAVLGPYRGGTSCVAGVCHKLGVDMGASFFKSPGLGYETYEARQLAAWCRKAYKEPTLQETSTYEERVAYLREWKRSRQRAVGPGVICGAKHPLLCLMIPELIEAWGEDTKFVFVMRDTKDVMASFERVKFWGWGPAKVKAAVERLLLDRTKLTRAKRVLGVDFEKLRSDSVYRDHMVEAIDEFLGTDAAPDQIQEALESIR